MKRILLSLVMLLSMTAVMAQNDTVMVATFPELKAAIQANPHANIRLTDDISIVDESGNTYDTFICERFYGSITGDYLAELDGEKKMVSHAIYGTTDETGKQRKNCNIFFGILDGATIDNVHFINLVVEDKIDDNIGLICRAAVNNCRFNDLTMTYVKVLCNHDNAGAVAGKATNCTFYNVKVGDSDIRTNGICAGGLVGKSSGCFFTSCLANMGNAVFSDGRFFSGGAYAGGLVGWSEGDRFEQCKNAGMVASDEDGVGGIAGKSIGSHFEKCYNTCYIVQCDEDEFYDKVVNPMRAQIAAVTKAKIEEITQHGNYVLDFVLEGLAGVISGALALGGAVKAGLVLFRYVEVAEQYLALANGAVFGVIAIVAIVAMAGSIIGIDEILHLHDEMGGICGNAEGSSFEQCVNSSRNYCRDNYGGGIVGLGGGVTINNCLNTTLGRYNQNTCGSIVGAIKDYDGKKSKVTNCLSLVDYPIIGKEEDEADPASGNNYVYDTNGDRAPSNVAMKVGPALMWDGTVCYWLNNGVENRSASDKPWRQDIFNDEQYPTLDDTHYLVQRNDLLTETGYNYREIREPGDLMSYSRSISNNQFMRAKLMNDIDMSDYEWEPIGKDESGKNFRGIFEGQGHTITGLKNKPSGEPAGLFGAVHVNAEITNVIVGERSEITSTGSQGAGGIVGRVSIGWHWGDVLIANCGNYASINGEGYAGGILGRVNVGDNAKNINVRIENCFNMGTVTATKGNSGLLCGYMNNQGIVYGCWSYGKLETASGDAPFKSDNYFVGYGEKLNISNCYTFCSEQQVDKWANNTQPGVFDFDDTELLTSGQLTYLFNGGSNERRLGLTWQQNIGKDITPTIGGKGVYHTREITNQKYGTVCLPYPLKSDAKVKLYQLVGVSEDESNVSLKFEFTETLTPGTPALFLALDDDDAYSFDDAYGLFEVETGYVLTPGMSSFSDWNIQGTFANQTFTGDDAKSIYYVSSNAIRNATTTHVNAYRAYFCGPSLNTSVSGSAKSVSFVIDDEDGTVTALELVGNDLKPVQNGKVYNLNGQRVNANQKGIVIKNGKKVLIK